MASTILKDKIEKACSTIVEQIEKHSAPVVYSSFGKDSMVLLKLVKLCGFKLPVIFHQEPFFEEKYRYARGIIEAEGYAVYDYPPSAVGVLSTERGVEVINFHNLKSQSMVLPTGIVAPGEGPFLCGLVDLVRKPTGTIDYPWDLAFVGHKSSDVDPIHGRVPLRSFVEPNRGGITMCFPIKDFTDEEVWAFHKAFKISPHTERYAEGKELSDKTHNPDYFPTCTACFGEEEVFCPLLKGPLAGQKGNIPFVTSEQIMPDYVQKEVR